MRCSDTRGRPVPHRANALLLGPVVARVPDAGKARATLVPVRYHSEKLKSVSLIVTDGDHQNLWIFAHLA